MKIRITTCVAKVRIMACTVKRLGKRGVIIAWEDVFF
jgi:hypothetical protein